MNFKECLIIRGINRNNETGFLNPGKIPKPVLNSYLSSMYSFSTSNYFSKVSIPPGVILRGVKG
jgi:hypothetical protein